MQTSFPGRAEIEAAQLESLNRLIRELADANPFYTPKLESAGLPDGAASLEAFSAAMPFTTKQEVVEDQWRTPPYGTNLTYPFARYTRFHQTSATTGRPMRWLDTPEGWDWMLSSWERVYRAAGLRADDAVFFAFSFGPFLGFWTAFDAAQRIGCLSIPGGALSSTGRLRVMIESRATVLLATPTYAIRLAQVAAAEGIDLSASAVRLIIVAGEPGGSIPSTRACTQRLWPGARVFDHHGMTEVGPVSFECPGHPGVLHVIESAYYAEIIDPESAEPVPPGGVGELVLTTLGRACSPLLRYRTGDQVRRGAPGVCACGRSDLALEGGILGRIDDMVVVRGVNIYPSAVEEVLRAQADAVEYRVEIRTRDALPEMRIEVEPASDCRDVSGLVGRLEAALRTAFNLRIPVEPVAPGALPRFELKADRWVKTGDAR